MKSVPKIIRPSPTQTFQHSLSRQVIKKSFTSRSYTFEQELTKLIGDIKAMPSPRVVEPIDHDKFTEYEVPVTQFSNRLAYFLPMIRSNSTLLIEVIDFYVTKLQSVQIKPAAESEFPPTYAYTNEYIQLHEGFRRLINMMPSNMQNHYLTPDLVRSFFLQLQIMEPDFQDSVMQTISLILNIDTNYVAILADQIPSILYDVALTGQFSLGIAAMLEMTVSLYSLLHFPMDHPVIAVLLNHPALSNFITPLMTLIDISDQVDQTACEYCLSHLAKNWPLTSSKKSLVYLHCIEDLLAIGGKIADISLVRKLYTNVINEVNSPAASNASQAIHLFDTFGFLEQIKVVPNWTTPLAEQLRLAVGNWSPYVSENATMMLTQLHSTKLPALQKNSSGFWQIISASCNAPLFSGNAILSQ